MSVVNQLSHFGHVALPNPVQGAQLAVPDASQTLETRFLAWISTTAAKSKCALDPDFKRVVKAMPKDTKDDLVQLFMAFLLFTTGFADWAWPRYTSETLLAFAKDLKDKQAAGVRMFRSNGPQNTSIDTVVKGKKQGWLHNLTALAHELQLHEAGLSNKVTTILAGIKSAPTYVDACKKPRALPGIGPYCAMRIVRDLFDVVYCKSPGLFEHHQAVVDSMKTQTPYGTGPKKVLKMLAGESDGRRVPFARMIVELTERATTLYGRPFTAVEVEDLLCKFSGSITKKRRREN